MKLFLSHVRGCDNRFIRISELVYLNTFRLHSLAGNLLISQNYLTVLVDRTKSAMILRYSWVRTNSNHRKMWESNHLTNKNFKNSNFRNKTESIS